MSSGVDIAGRKIGPGHPPYIVAEVSGNHNGDINRALKMLDAAKAAGADAVKLQTYTADTMTIDCDRPEFMIQGGLWGGRRLYELYQEAQTPWDWHHRLFAHARDLGIEIFSTPFDFSAADFLDQLGAPAFKIASFEAIDTPLIRHCAAKGKPIVLSTGMAGLGEIEEAVAAARSGGEAGLILLHCVSAYPSPAADANLRTIPHLAQAFGVPAGLSDHTLGVAVSVAAVALGACFIEKHFTLARADGGPDAGFSLEPDELARLVSECRDAWAALGAVSYAREESEGAMSVFRRSLYVVRDVAAGEAFTPDNIRSIRPGLGLPPKHYDVALQSVATRDLKRGEPLDWSMIAQR